MILVLALLLCGVAALGLWLAGDFTLLLACWSVGLALHAGLAAQGRSRRAAAAAREAFLAESAGACVLAIAGLALALAVGTARLDLLAERLPSLAPESGVASWAGVAVVLAVASRLGLPPLPWWPARLTAAPSAVRVFLLAGLHPATAILLWFRLADWLQPWHEVLAQWFGGSAAVLLMLAAAGERHAARRATWLGASHWAGLLVAAGAPLAAVWSLAFGMGLVQLQTVFVRWPVAWQRLCLAAGSAGVLAAAVLSPPADPASGPAMLRLAAAMLSVWVFYRWLRDAASAAILPPAPLQRRPAVAPLAGVARRGQGSGPLPLLAGVSVRALGRLVAGFDRIVLAGVADGLGWIALGLGWLVAWIDRRGQDAVYGGAAAGIRLTGRAVVQVAGGRSRRALAAALLVILGLAWLGRSAG